MQCLILAGGLGTRVKEISDGRPKALLPIGTKTFIQVQLEWLKIGGVESVVMAIGHQSDEIRKHIESLDIKKIPNIIYSTERNGLLGTGGALKNALPVLWNDFIVSYGDSFLLIDPRSVFWTHERNKYPITMAILENNNRHDQSNVFYKDDTLIYRKSNPTKEMTFIDYGMMVFNKKWCEENFPNKEHFDLAQILETASAQKFVGPFLVEKPFFEIGTPSGYLRTQQFLSDYNYDLEQISHEIANDQ